MDGLKPYPAYKESGLPWLGPVPAHWDANRGKVLFTKVNRPVRNEDDVVTCFRDGIVTLRKNRRVRGFTEAFFEVGYQGIRKGDLVIHAMDAFAGAIGVSDSDGKGTPVYAVCEPTPRANSNYYAYVIREMARSQWIQALSRGIRERSTDFRYETFGRENLPVPSIDEQAAIVRFLDHATQRIDRAVRAKRKTIALLNEQKQAIIHRAVTRGLDADVPLKDSGIPWLGRIPAHWEIRRAKQLCRAIIDCKNRTPEMIAEGGFTVIRTTNVRSGRFSLLGSYPTDKRNFDIWTERGAPRVGDVFFTREAPAGEACLVPDLSKICLGQRMMYFRPDPSVLDSAYLVHSIYGPVGRTYIENACNGSTVGHLRLGQVSALPLLWCPIEEQRSIVLHVCRESAPIEKTSDRIRREIDLLREYRTRLIADVVTGKLDVRAVAASLPEIEMAPEAAAEPDDYASDETLDELIEEAA